LGIEFKGVRIDYGDLEETFAAKVLEVKGL
jgi:hypothetical protein